MCHRALDRVEQDVPTAFSDLHSARLGRKSSDFREISVVTVLRDLPHHGDRRKFRPNGEDCLIASVFRSAPLIEIAQRQFPIGRPSLELHC